MQRILVTAIHDWILASDWSNSWLLNTCLSLGTNWIITALLQPLERMTYVDAVRISNSNHQDLSDFSWTAKHLLEVKIAVVCVE